MARYLQIIDFGSYTHALLNAYPRIACDQEAFLKYNLMCMLSGCLVEPMMSVDSTVETIIIEDAKPYWRHGLLWEMYNIDYKGNRTKQPQRAEFVEGIRGKCLSLFKEWDIKTLRLLASTPIANKICGYEADDGVAGVIKTIGANYDGIFTLTVDSDYLPFTVDSRIIWCCTGHYLPRVRTAKEALFWCKTSRQTTVPKYKKLYPWSSPAQLWDFKAYYGDQADHLRGNRIDKTVGKYEPFVDLFEPHSDFKCWNEDQFVDLLDYVITAPITPITFFDYNSDCYFGQNIAVYPLRFEQTTL